MFDCFSLKFLKAGCFSIALLIFIPCFGLSPSFAAGPDSREYVLKAGYIYNFTKFTKWPEQPNSQIKNGGLNFCLMGKDPFGNILDNLAKSLKKKNRDLRITRQVSNEQMSQCHILFVSQSETSNLNQILLRAGKYPILVIGDTPGFGKRGVGINFFLQKNKIRFEINREALKGAGLVVSSELLNLGKIVAGGKMR